jgi:hypothetical protein
MNEQPLRRQFRFGLRTLFELVAVVAFILTLVYYRRTPLEPGAARYQLQVVAVPDGAFGSQQWVIDTHTGEVWRLDGAQWISRGPAPPHRE